MNSFRRRYLPATPVATDAVANDAFRNLAARMGVGTPSLAEGTEYDLIRWTNDYWLMITLFRNHWISRRIVEKPAQDMCKAWARLKCKLKPDAIAMFDRTVARTYTQSRIQTALKWARLFGGAGALMVIDGHEDILDEPLELNDIAPGSYKGLIVFDRWAGITPQGNVSNDINSPLDFGYPSMYRVTGESGEGFEIHPSRILRFCGPEVPYPERASSLYWGISELEIAYEEMRKRDNMSWSILQLLFRAQLLVRKDPDLAQILSGASAGQMGAMKANQIMQAQNELLSNQSMLILGKDGELQSHQYTFGGVSDIYQEFKMDIAGCARIPMSILFGRTSTGLGQSNDNDIRIYEQEIAQKQSEELKPQLDKLYPVICMSDFGEVPDDLDFEFPSVRVLTEEEKSTKAGSDGEIVIAAFAGGLISQKTALMELKASGDKTEIFTNITDKDIENADDSVMNPLEMMEAEAELKPKPNDGEK